MAVNIIELSNVLTCWKLREACKSMFSTTSLMDVGVELHRMSHDPACVTLVGFGTSEKWRGTPIIFGYARRANPFRLYVCSLNDFDINTAREDFSAELRRAVAARWGHAPTSDKKLSLVWSR